MAFGLSPKHVQEISLDHLSPQHFLVIALETAKKLDWNLSLINENGFIAFTKFSLSSYSEEITVKIDNNKAVLKSQCTGSQLVDWGKNKENISLFIESIADLRGKYSEEEIIEKYEELKPGFGTKDGNNLNHSPSNAKEKLKGVFSIFIPTHGYFITPILIILNIVIFVIMSISGVNVFMPDNESLINWGANFRPETLDGEWWRLLTSCFLHIGILHLFMNMYALLYIGLLLEPYLGKTRFLASFLLTGIIASVSSLWWNDLTISAGASGAIFGMYGIFLAMLTTNLIEKSARQALLTSIAIFVGFNLLNGLKGEIDNAAHIGGLVSGVLIGYSFYPGLKHPNNNKQKYGLIVLLSIFVLVISSLVYTNIKPYDFDKYDIKMKTFSEYELKALEMYKMAGNVNDYVLVQEVKTKSLYYWKENIEIIKEVEQLNLPETIHKRNKILKQYCELRIQSCALIIKLIEEQNTEYQSQIEQINSQIDELLKSISKKE